MTYEYLANLLKLIALSPNMVDLPCKAVEVASPESEDGGNLRALQWGLTYLAKRSRSLALNPRMVVGAFISSSERGGGRGREEAICGSSLLFFC
jgi:hypothetical protein